MPGSEIVCFGELLLRLDPPRQERLMQATEFSVSYTGGEANTAVALAHWGEPAKIVSKVPLHELGQACLNQIRRFGVDVSEVRRGGDRLGLLYVEIGAGQRSPRVIYDRQHTSFRTIQPGEFDWDHLLRDANWFHFSGTAPAIGEGVRTCLFEALECARSKGLKVSFDSSYRSALWSVDEASQMFRKLLPWTDVYIGSESDVSQFFGLTVPAGDDVLTVFRERFSLECAAFCERDVQPIGTQTYWSRVATREGVHESTHYPIQVVDRIGAGDAFTAGLIRALRLRQPLRDLAEFATAAAVLAHSLQGDFTLVSTAEVEQLVASGPRSRGWR